MKKGVFTWSEAKTVAFDTPPPTLKLQLHLWKRAGEIVAVRRGVYGFTDSIPETEEILKALYPPCYVSLESALSIHGLIPDVPFATTGVTTRPSRNFSTPWGTFIFRRLKSEAFKGFDPKTLIAFKEKAVVDYLFFSRRRFGNEKSPWQERRWQNLRGFNFRRARKYARAFGSGQLTRLIGGLEDYATTHDVD